MECERLTKLIKNWYIQVKDETLAPARMADFMRSHISSCPVCLSDSSVESEVKKIIEIILPASKVPKAANREEEPDLDPKETADDESEEEQDEDDDQSDEMDEGEEDEEIDDEEDDF